MKSGNARGGSRRLSGRGTANWSRRWAIGKKYEEEEYSWLMVLGSLLAGGAGVYLVLHGNAAVAAGCHLASAALGGRAAIASDGRRLGTHSFLAVLAFCLPFLGGAAAFYLSEAIKRKKTGHLAEEFSIYLNDAASFRESVPVSDPDAPPPEGLVSLADVLAAPSSEAEQRIAVENLAGMETPDAMGILRRVAESDSGEGRLFAMTAIGQFEERILGKLLRLEERLEAEGDAPASETLLEAARANIDLSYFHLAQDMRRGECLARAGEFLTRALENPETGEDAWILLGRVRLMEYDGEDALRCFEQYLRNRPDSATGHLWRAEAWYVLENYAKVRADCLKARSLGGIPAGICSSVECWLSGTAGPDSPAAPGGENGD